MAEPLPGDVPPGQTEVTLPDVLVTPPGIEKTPGAPPPGPVLAHDAHAVARLFDHAWDDVHQHEQQGRQAALDAGHTPDAIDEHFGWPTDRQGQDRLDQTLASHIVDRPDLKPDEPPPLLRSTYADALDTGAAKGATDFASKYLQSYQDQTGRELPPEAREELTKALPSHEDVTDASLLAASKSGLPMGPRLVSAMRQGVLDQWSQTGQTPQETMTAISRGEIDPTAWLRPTPEPWTLSAALGRVYEATKAGVKDAYEAPLGGGRDDWGISAKQPEIVNDAKILAYIAAKDADALMRVPMAMALGVARGSRQLLVEAGVPEGAADRTMRDALALAAATGAKEKPSAAFKVKVIDPLKAPAEAVAELPAEEAYTGKVPVKPELGEPIDTAHWDIGGAIYTHFHNLMIDTAGSIDPRLFFSTSAKLMDKAEQAAWREVAKAVIRKHRGMAERVIAANFATVEEYRKTLNEHVPEYQKWLRQGADPATAPVLKHLLDYAEGRSAGATLDPASKLAPVADVLRAIGEHLRSAMSDKDFDHFYQDYYRHMWTDPRAADRAFGTELKRLPSVGEGIERGLTPRILDPIESTLNYASSMARYLSIRKIQEGARDAGYAKYAYRAPEPSWVPLKGMSATKPVPIKGADGKPSAALMRLYAPKGFAGAYNSWVGKGVYDWPTVPVKLGPVQFEINPGTIYDKLQYAANAMTGLKLALSGYHTFNIIQETVAANLTNGLGELAGGDLVQGLKSMGYGTSIIGGVADYAARGRAFQKKYLDSNNTDPVVELLTEAGFRPLGRSAAGAGGRASADITMAAGRPSLWTSFSRRSLGWEFAQGIRSIGGSAEEAAGTRVAAAPFRAAGAFANVVGRVLDQLNAPLFDHLIPWVKTGAAVDEMESWIRRNPTATQGEKLAQARKISDSMDDRFGELNQDNLFWPRAVKQFLNLATISIGWEYGTLRAFGGGTVDLLGNDPRSTRARWMIAYPATVALMSAIYQTLVTGQPPSRVEDLFLPRTGGVVKSSHSPTGFVPELGLAPGYEKDVLQYYKLYATSPDFFALERNLGSFTWNKANPFWHALHDTWTGEDSQGNKYLNDPEPPFQQWGLPPHWGNWLQNMGEAIEPIPAEQQVFKGSMLSPAERWLGYRPAPYFLEAPKEAADAAARREQRERKTQQFRRNWEKQNTE